MNVHHEHGIDVIVERLSTRPDEISASFELLSESERRRATRYVFDRDRLNFIARRAQLRRFIGERLDCPPSLVEFSTGPKGKPSLTSPETDPHLRFNISHAEDLTMYAFSTVGEIGVDVEAMRAVEDADQIAPLALSTREQAAYRRVSADLRPLAFLYAWTRKEAFVKATGTGLSDARHTRGVTLTADAPARIVHADGVDGRRHGWRVRSLFPAAGFVAAIVAEMR